MLITEDYRAQQAALHAKGDYGTASLQYGETVAALLKSTAAQSVLDYGCGSKRSLLQALALPAGVVYEGYDPAIPAYSASPIPAELVCCIDVLEHIEPHLLDNVLDHLGDLCDPYGFFTVHTGPARKVLSDGRNAHLTQQGAEWWLPRFKARFDVLAVHGIPSGFAIVTRSLKSSVQLPLPGPLVLPATPVAAATAATIPRSMPTAAAPSAPPGMASPGVAQMVFKYKGDRIVFEVPNEGIARRVQALLNDEPETMRWLEAVSIGATLLDVGANIGVHSMFAAVTRKAVVYAFEPEAQSFAILNANIAANELAGRVLAFPLALSDGARLDRLYRHDASHGPGGHSFAEDVGFDLKPGNGEFVQGAYGVTIDHLIEMGSMPVPDCIRVDVGGLEHKVLRGAAKTLSNPKVRQLLIELNMQLDEHKQAVEWLSALGFSLHERQSIGAASSPSARQGVGYLIFRRKDRAGISGAWNRQVVITTGPTARGRAVLRHVLDRVATAEIISDPFPYSVIDGILPDDYYAEVLAHFPAPDSLRPIGDTGRVPSDAYRERNVVLFSDDEFRRMTDAQQRFWHEFAGWMYSDLFLSAFVAKFHQALEPRLSRILAESDALEVRGDALLVNDQTNYAIGPHTDAPHRLVTFLFYLPHDASMRELGTSVFRAKDPNFVCWGGPHYPFEKFDLVRTVEFLPNRLLAFPKTERSFHGVEKIQREGINRPLLINNIRLLNSVTH